MDTSFAESQVSTDEEISSCFSAYKAFQEASCCKRRCVNNVPPMRALTLRKRSLEMSALEKRNFLKDFFMTQADGLWGRFLYVIDGKYVCRKCWTFLHNVKLTWFYDILKKLREGRTNFERLSQHRCPSTAALTARSWLEQHAKETGDRAPDEKKIYLPSCLSKKAIFKCYAAEVDSKQCISYVSFARIWRENCSHIRLRKISKFSKCGVCVILRHILASSRNTDFRDYAINERKLHVQQQAAERASYYVRRKKAQDCPENFVSLIIDGMDQQKTNLPHFTELSKAQFSEFYKIRLTGVISHGTKENFIFLDELEWSHDSNHTMNVLLKALLKISQDGVLPPVLYIQMDNCWRENKNQFVFGLCAVLVHRKIVKKRFSLISDILRRRSATTMDSLQRTIEESQTPRPEVESLKFLYNIREWLVPHLNTIKYHTIPHAFKFEAFAGTVRCHYKMWATDQGWSGPVEFLNSFPEDAPALVRPLFVKQISLKEARLNLTTCTQLSIEERAWWENFIISKEKIQGFWRHKDLKTHCQTGQWILTQFRPCRDALVRTELTDNEKLLKQNLDAMLAKEMVKVEIVVTKPRCTESKKHANAAK